MSQLGTKLVWVEFSSSFLNFWIKISLSIYKKISNTPPHKFQNYVFYLMLWFSKKKQQQQQINTLTNVFPKERLKNLFILLNATYKIYQKIFLNIKANFVYCVLLLFVFILLLKLIISWKWRLFLVNKSTIWGIFEMLYYYY